MCHDISVACVLALIPLILFTVDLEKKEEELFRAKKDLEETISALEDI